MQLVRVDKSPLGKGGMSSKLQAARTMTDAGEAMIVADGRMPNVLLRLIDGEELGTLFAPAMKKRSGRSRWIGGARPEGTIIIDDGAVKALVDKNRSLLVRCDHCWRMLPMTRWCTRIISWWGDTVASIRAA
jgi:glutamate 5-kinase